MKHYKNRIVLALSLMVCTAYAQEPTRYFLSVEAGSSFVTGRLNPNWKVRQDVGSYEYEYMNANSIHAEMTISSIGIKPGMSFFGNKVQAYSGLRYTHINSDLSKNSTLESAFFYLSDHGTTDITDFYKIKHITEDNDYLGVPLEILVLPFKNDYFDFYLKAGAELNFRFHTSRDIKFLNPDMEPYQDLILEHANVTTNSIYASVYSAIGIRLGRKNNVKYDLELLLPSYILTRNNSSLILPDFYSGVRFAVQFPCKKTGTKKAE
jgi:hypothetical protein